MKIHDLISGLNAAAQVAFEVHGIDIEEVEFQIEDEEGNLFGIENVKYSPQARLCTIQTESEPEEDYDPEG